jgi:hypothetical protein
MAHSPAKIVSIGFQHRRNSVGIEYFLSGQIRFWLAAAVLDARGAYSSFWCTELNKVELVFHFLYPCVTAAGFGCNRAAECADRRSKLLGLCLAAADRWFRSRVGIGEPAQALAPTHRAHWLGTGIWQCYPLRIIWRHCGRPVHSSHGAHPVDPGRAVAALAAARAHLSRAYFGPAGTTTAAFDQVKIFATFF